MASFKDLKKKSAEQFTKMADSIKNTNQNFNDDPRLWYPGVDKAGNGQAVIRFLPAPPDGDGGIEDQAYVRVWSHSFKGPTGQWYIENCRSTIKEADPVNEYNTALWATEIEANQKQARVQKRATSYYANIYVIKDPLNPENEGKVKIFRFGPVIFDFIKAKLVPEFDDQTPVKIFDFDEGANFRIRIRTEGEYRKYDRSEFDAPSSLFDGDEDKQEEVWNQEYSLAAFIASDKFKSYDDLKKRLNKVLGLENSSAQVKSEEKTLAAPEPKKIEQKDPVVASDDDDEDIALFKKLAMDDDD